MKKLLLLHILIMASILGFAQTPNMEISTMRIGPFKLFMSKSEAESYARKPLLVADSTNEWRGESIVKYNNELLTVAIAERWESERRPNEKQITSLSTKSTKFRTKSGLGVGSKKSELINAYKDFQSFSVYPEWNNDGKPSKTVSFFNLSDLDANTILSFKMVNNVVVEVSVYFEEGGC